MASSGTKRPFDVITETSTAGAQKRSRFDVSTAAQPSITAPSVAAPYAATAIGQDAVARAAAIAAQIANQMRSTSSTATSTGGVAASAQLSSQSATFAPKRIHLDSQGRMVDEHGNVLESDRRGVSTLRVNDPNRVVAADQIVTRADKPAVPAYAAGPGGRFNPYLAHRVVAAQAQAQAASGFGQAGGTSSVPSAAGQEAPKPVDAAVTAVLEAADAEARRRRRADRALHFVSEGTYASMGEAMREEDAKRAEVEALRQRGGRNRPLRHREEQAVPPTSVETSAQITPGEESAVAPITTPAYPLAEAAAAAAAASSAATAAAAAMKEHSLASLPPKSRDAIPSIEWWDAEFLPPAQAKAYKGAHSVASKKAANAAALLASKQVASTSEAAEGAAAEASVPSVPQFSYSDVSVQYCRTLSLVQHPIPITPFPEANGGPSLALPLMLTKEERRKVRRQQRAERHKFLLDQQKLGLLPPPEPKVRLANMMRVLKDAAVADPSAVEAKVREQMAARMKAHEQHNKAKQLKPEQKLEKWARKMRKHGPSGPEAAVFRVCDLSHGKTRYKVDVAAREHFLGGVALIAKTAGVCLVYVEGGTRAVQRYIRILSRVHWRKAAREVELKRQREARGEQGEEEDEEEDEDEDGDDSEEEDGDGGGDAAASVKHGYGPGGLCELVWSGVAPRRYFPDGFTFEECRTSGTGRKLMETKGLAHLWDIVSHSEHARRVGLGEESDPFSDAEAGGAGTGAAAGGAQEFEGEGTALRGLLSTGLLSSALLQQSASAAGFHSHPAGPAGSGALAGEGKPYAGGAGAGAGARSAEHGDSSSSDSEEDDDDAMEQ